MSQPQTDKKKAKKFDDVAKAIHELSKKAGHLNSHDRVILAVTKAEELISTLKPLEGSFEDAIAGWEHGTVGEFDTNEPYMSIGCAATIRHYKALAELLQSHGPSQKVEEAVGELGRKIAKLAITAIRRDTLDMQSAQFRLVEPAIKATKRNVGTTAADGRWAEPRKLLEDAAGVASKKWLGGDTMKHDQMKNFLLDDYVDSYGKYPFAGLNPNTLLRRLSKAARDLGLRKLITGERDLT